MRFDLDRPRRRSIRLKNYDYSRAGAYFVTVCVRKRLCLFGDIVEGQMCASPAGKMVAKAWDELPGNYAGVVIDSFVLMPNHIHGVIVLNPTSVGAAPCGRPSCLTTTNQGQPRGVAPTNDKRFDVVQRRPQVQILDYEHVIRNDDDWEKTREYISTNPYTWVTDVENPVNNMKRTVETS